MKKSVSILAIMLVGVMSAFPSKGAQMTSQIQRLLEQKEEKIKKLEECEGKKKGWMIAGISTIGVTAVGVGVNIAQANKSNKLSGEIEQSKQELERQQERLSRIEGQISKKEQEAKAEREKAEREKAETKIDHNDYKDREPDGKIGAPCDDGRGTWVVGIDDTNKVCLDANGNGLQPCHCDVKADDGARVQPKPKEETSLQKCLREWFGNAEGTACCYLAKSVATYENGKCQCKGDKEFSIGVDGRGKCTSVKNGDTSRNSDQKDGYGYIEFNGGGEYTEICSLFEPGTWCAVINNKTYNGDALCSAVESSFGDIADISGSGTGMYCYCRLSSGSKWVNVEQTTSCETTCAYHCAYQFYSNRSFRNYFK